MAAPVMQRIALMKMYNKILTYLFLIMIVTNPGKVEAAHSDENMVFIRGGCFMMGDTFGDGKFFEKPPKVIRIVD